MLKKILQNPQDWAFEDDEWLEIFLMASSESLIGELYKKGQNHERLLGKWGQPAADLFKAEALRQNKKLPQAMQLYNSVISARKAAPRLVCVVHGAIHAVAEAELAGEMDRDASRFVREVVGADLFDDGAVVGRRKLAGDGLLHVEALAEYEGLRRGPRLPSPVFEERRARRDLVERPQFGERVPAD